MNENFSSLFIPIPISPLWQKIEIPSALGNVRPSGNYAWETQAKTSRRSVTLSGKDQPPPVYMESGVTEMATASNVGTSGTTGMVLLETNFVVACNRHEDQLLKVN